MTDIITIDGPASSGKGTVAKMVANALQFNYLDSGSIYRAFGFWVQKHNIFELDEKLIIKLINSMNLQFIDGAVILNEEDITIKIRDEHIGMLASKYGALPMVRDKLLNFQRSFANGIGLVTDGRDMGSVVFPNAKLKVFLTASAEKRAERRYKQLQQFDKSATIEDILNDIIARDLQDSTRVTAPLGYDASYKVLDNSDLDIDGTVKTILNWCSELG